MGTYPIGMICRPWVTINGERIYAKDYGKRAFCFIPRNKKELPLVAVVPQKAKAKTLIK